jgi:alpha-tubulin suppressor-like RCC1 family protein
MRLFLSCGALTLCIASCGGDAGRLDWQIGYAEAGLATTVSSVRARISRGACPGSTSDIVYSATLRPDGSGGPPMDPGVLRRGDYAFWAQGLDGTCQVIAEGCVARTLPGQRGTVVVPLMSRAPVAGCVPGEVCESGRCRPMGGDDAGPIPCMMEGSSCADGEGTCHDGMCCLGCWDGMGCRGGASVNACGTRGGMCETCGIGQPCGDGVCRAQPADGQFALSAEHSMLLLDDGVLFSAGANRFMQLGPGAMPEEQQFSEVTTTVRFARIAAAQFTTCGLTRSDGELQCFGTNAGGTLALNDVSTRVEVAPRPALTAERFVDIAAGDAHFCAISDEGALFCWGTGTYGQTGLGTPSPTGLPMEVMAGSRFGRVSALNLHTCAIRGDGALFCFGSNRHGQIAQPAGGPETCGVDPMRFSCSTTPVRVGSDNDWIDVSAGLDHTCGIRRGGTLYCWGVGADGQLGQGGTMGLSDQHTPLRVGTDTGWTHIAAGEFHSCGIVMGSARCWGTGIQGALGLGSRANAYAPTPPGGSDFVAIAAGWKHTCAIRSVGRVCWGDNAENQLGLMGMEADGDALVPTEVVLVPAP